MDLYTYFRSSAAYRVRIALNLKNLSYTSIPVHLVRDGGEQHKRSYHSVNPTHLVPTWRDEFITTGQSLAIIEYLDERYTTNPLLPKDVILRAKIRAFSQTIACDIHPINNLRVLRYLKENFAAEEEQIKQWYVHWITEGFNALELQLHKKTAQTYCFGSEPSMADCCLVPQVYNAQRYDMDMAQWPNIQRINSNCMINQAFTLAHPELQKDAQ